uniref:Guanylate cyclase n=1 Tax=Caenorhabditis tropicalis TaxID=1561998 RepID=A0A1I7T6G5_9PELO
MISILVFFLVTVNCQPPGKIFHLGFLHCDIIPENVEGSSSYISYRTSASAASIAVDRIKQENLLLGYDFKFTILYDQCDENLAAGNAVKLFVEHNVDALIGPTTNIPAIPVFTLATYYNIPVVTWGMTSSAALDDAGRYPTAGIISIGSRSLAVAFRELMLEYKWDQFVYAYSLEGDDEKCETMRDDFQNMIAYYGDIVLSYSVQIMDQSEEGLLAVLKDVSTRGRSRFDSEGPVLMVLTVIVPCFHEGNTRGLHRRWMLVAARNGFVTEEYVYIFPSLRSKGYGKESGSFLLSPYLSAVLQSDGSYRYPWVDSTGPQASDQEALLGFQRSMFIVDMQGQGKVMSNYSVFEKEVIRRMKLSPYNCTDACSAPEYQMAATYAGQLHDAVYLYGIAMDKMMKTNPSQYRNGTAFPPYLVGTFEGVGGTIVIDDSGGRSPTLFVLTLSPNNTASMIMTVDVDQQVAEVTKLYTNEAAAVWHSRKGIRPLDEPACGYTGSLCPANVFFEYLGWFLAAIGVIFLTIMGAIMAFVFLCQGSLSNVIRKASIQMDGFFIYSLMKDIVNGLTWIHESSYEFHGMLTSKNCLLNDRWQLKITDFGLKNFRTQDQYTKADRLWTAPELLRNDSLIGSREGDVYSLGIISAELITRSSAFDLENRREDADEIVYMLKKGGLQSPRPSLDHDESLEINPALLHLVRDCWTERPSERPDMKQVASQLRSMNTNRNDNLMDHVFNVLESYASTLEDEVAERMKELVEEKKKSDVLLYRMLPRQVADKLKLGQTVEPETFDTVTLFFSDVVSFTTLAGKCTPLQVVNLLNGLYTIFDGIIEEHDVYKVETIGDGYFVASGVPRRNGNEHTRNIASMALAFVKSMIGFSVPHLPGEKINIRVGFHCGSVVAGVVGLTMPRYCLFGDAVNTASRMESNSKPGHVHISEEANELLTKLGGFITEARGEVLGKGVMQTYWLQKMDESAAPKNFKNQAE